MAASQAMEEKSDQLAAKGAELAVKGLVELETADATAEASLASAVDGITEIAAGAADQKEEEE